MLQAVAEAHSVDQHDLHITASIGVSIYPDDGLDAETLIKNADTAMYQAKENGRQSYQFFKPAMNVRAVERQSIEEGLRTRVRTTGIRAPLPAEDQSEDREDYRRGSIAPLDASDSGAGSSGTIYSCCRRLRPYFADRQLGSSRSVQASPSLGGCWPVASYHGGEHLRDGVPEKRTFWKVYSQSLRMRAWIRNLLSWS